jgi:phage terminase large subunit-like protein
VWSNIAVTAYDRHEADIIVGEVNYGGAMVGRVIQTAPAGLGRRIPYKTVTATRGKVIRAEPFSALYEQGKVRHAGQFVELEGQLAAMSTHGYLGEGSPNNADAWIWVLTELFGGIINATRRLPKQGGAGGNRSGTSFMGD